MKRRAFTIVELVLAMAILSVALLALLSVCSTALRANRKGIGASTAQAVAERELSRAVTLVQSDEPTGAKAQFWDNDYNYPDSPWCTGQTAVGSTAFSFAIYAHTLIDSSTGVPVGNGEPNNRLKKVDAVVWWWSEDGTRRGYGTLRAEASRVVCEHDAP